jgi:hypothetical protein
MLGRSTKPRTTRLGRFLRGHRPDRNPLRRGSDRAETAVVAALVVAFLAGAPFAAQAAGGAEHAAAQRVQAAQQASWRQVPAVLLATPGTDAGVAQVAQARARFTAPDGKTIVTDVPVPNGTRAGTTVRVWVTRDGTLTAPPLLDSQVAEQAVVTELATVAGLALTLATVGFLARRSLDKRRLAAWDAEWRAAGPRMNNRHN